jgi:tRNA(Arg) A34 adenosine deaminase TadA
MELPEIRIQLPPWVAPFLHGYPQRLPDVGQRMALVLELSRLNVRHRSGGPFGAAVFDPDGGLIAPGVNLVVSANCSLLHAETVALALAQFRLGRYDLSDGGRVCCELVATTEPCAMCLGAIPWSGVGRLVCGARDADARAIGFDEGPKRDDWVEALNRRGIAVQRDVMRQEACAVLAVYRDAGGPIYNSGLQGMDPASKRTS